MAYETYSRGKRAESEVEAATASTQLSTAPSAASRIKIYVTDKAMHLPSVLHSSAIMGAIGAHQGHSYVVETVAFFITLLFPGGVLALLGGAIAEKVRRRGTISAAE